VDELGLDLSKIKSTKDLEPWFYKANEEYGLYVWQNTVQLDDQMDRIEEPIVGLRPGPNETEVIACDFDPMGIDAIKLNNKWFKDGLVSPNLTRETSGDEEFKSGKYFAITYQLKPGKDKELEPGIGYELVQVETNTPQIANSETTGAMLAIPEASTHKDEAFDFIKTLYTDEKLLNIIVWGEEDKDYKTVKPGIIDPIQDSGWDWANGWTLGDQFKNFLTSNEDPDKWEKFNKFNEAGVPLSSLGFVPDTTDVDMQTWIAGVKAVRENYDDLRFGYVDDIDGTIKKMKADYEAAGINELVAAYQEQFDAWRKSK
jgi:putative aldouronate transport system substrate-binding protein